MARSLNQIHRIVRRSQAKPYSDEEQTQLLQWLRNAPGIDRAKVIGAHPKGGYEVAFQLVSSDAFRSALENCDWMLVF